MRQTSFGEALRRIVRSFDPADEVDVVAVHAHPPRVPVETLAGIGPDPEIETGIGRRRGLGPGGGLVDAAVEEERHGIVPLLDMR